MKPADSAPRTGYVGWQEDGYHVTVRGPRARDGGDAGRGLRRPRPAARGRPAGAVLAHGQGIPRGRAMTPTLPGREAKEAEAR